MPHEIAAAVWQLADLRYENSPFVLTAKPPFTDVSGDLAATIDQPQIISRIFWIVSAASFAARSRSS